MTEMCPNVLHYITFEDDSTRFGYVSKQAPFGRPQGLRASQATNDIGNMSVPFRYFLRNDPLMTVFQVLVETVRQL